MTSAIAVIPKVTFAHRPNPFRSHVELREFDANTSVANMFRAIGVTDFSGFTVYINGLRIDEDPETVFPNPGVAITTKTRPRGIELLFLVFSAILEAALAAELGAFVAYTLAVVGTAIVGTAVGYVYYLSFQALAPSESSSDDLSAGSGPSPTIRGTGNRINPDGPVWELLGRHKIYPPYGARPYTEVTEGSQYLRAMFTIAGPVQWEEATLKLGDTPITDFEEVETSLIAGLEGDLSHPSVIPYAASDDLPAGGNTQLKSKYGDQPWIEHTLTEPAEEVVMDFAFPSGVKRINESGKNRYFTNFYEFQWKFANTPDSWKPMGGAHFPLLGAAHARSEGSNFSIFEVTTDRYKIEYGKTDLGSSYTSYNSFRYTGNQHYSSFVTVRWVPSWTDMPTPAAISVRVRLGHYEPINSYTPDRDGNGADATVVFGDSTWVSVSGFVYEPPMLQSGYAHIGVRIKATEQLSGSIETLNIIGTRMVHTWTPSPRGWSSSPIATQNPAWLALHVLRGPTNINPMEDDELNLDSWYDFAVHCEPVAGSYKFTFNGVIDTDQNMMDVVKDIVRAGRASPTLIDGKLGVVVDEEQIAPVTVVTPRNILAGTLKMTRRCEIQPDAIRIKFLDEDNDWQPDIETIYNDGYGEKDISVPNLDAEVVAATRTVEFDPDINIADFGWKPGEWITFSGFSNPSNNGTRVLESLDRETSITQTADLPAGSFSMETSDWQDPSAQTITRYDPGGSWITDGFKVGMIVVPWGEDFYISAPAWDRFGYRIDSMTATILNCTCMANYAGERGYLVADQWEVYVTSVSVGFLSGENRFEGYGFGSLIVVSDPSGTLVDETASGITISVQGARVIEDSNSGIGRTKRGEVWTLGRWLYRQGVFRPRVFEFEQDFENLAIRRGNMFRFMHDTPLLGLASGRIMSIESSGSDITQIELDEDTFLDPVKTYGIEVRIPESDPADRVKSYTIHTANTLSARPVNTFKLLVFAAPLPQAGDFTVGDLVTFGEAGLISRDLICVGIEHSNDLQSKITAIDHGVDPVTGKKVWDVDGEVIPDFFSGITIPSNPELTPPPAPVFRKAYGSILFEYQTIDVVTGDGLITIHARIGKGARGRVDSIEAQWREVGSASWIPLGAEDRYKSSWTFGPVSPDLIFEARIRSIANEYHNAPGLTSDWVSSGAIELSQTPEPKKVYVYISAVARPESVITYLNIEPVIASTAVATHQGKITEPVYFIIGIRFKPTGQYLDITGVGHWEDEVFVISEGTKTQGVKGRARRVRIPLFDTGDYIIDVRTISAAGLPSPVVTTEFTADIAAIFPKMRVTGLEVDAQGNNNIFGGVDPEFTWRVSSESVHTDVDAELFGADTAQGPGVDPYFKDYEVEVFQLGPDTPAGVKGEFLHRTTLSKHYTTTESFRYHLYLNRQDTKRYPTSGDPYNLDGSLYRRKFGVAVRMRSRTGAFSNWSYIIVENPVPAAPTFTLPVVHHAPEVLRIEFDPVDDADHRGFLVWAAPVEDSINPLVDPPTVDVSRAFAAIIPVEPARKLDVHVAAYDVFHKAGASPVSELNITSLTDRRTRPPPDNADLMLDGGFEMSDASTPADGAELPAPMVFEVDNDPATPDPPFATVVMQAQVVNDASNARTGEQAIRVARVGAGSGARGDSILYLTGHQDVGRRRNIIAKQGDRFKVAYWVKNAGAIGPTQTRTIGSINIYDRDGNYLSTSNVASLLDQATYTYVELVTGPITDVAAAFMVVRIRFQDWDFATEWFIDDVKVERMFTEEQEDVQAGQIVGGWPLALASVTFTPIAARGVRMEFMMSYAAANGTMTIQFRRDGTPMGTARPVASTGAAGPPVTDTTMFVFTDRTALPSVSYTYDVWAVAGTPAHTVQDRVLQVHEIGR